MKQAAPEVDLCASICDYTAELFSKNVEPARKLAIDHFDTGMVFINGLGLAMPTMPFGGVKDSGYGREHGGFRILEFVHIKSVVINA